MLKKLNIGTHIVINSGSKCYVYNKIFNNFKLTTISFICGDVYSGKSHYMWKQIAVKVAQGFMVNVYVDSILEVPLWARNNPLVKLMLDFNKNLLSLEDLNDFDGKYVFIDDVRHLFHIVPGFIYVLVLPFSGNSFDVILKRFNMMGFEGISVNQVDKINICDYNGQSFSVVSI